jgi:hypothetical protein
MKTSHESNIETSLSTNQRGVVVFVGCGDSTSTGQESSDGWNTSVYFSRTLTTDREWSEVSQFCGVGDSVFSEEIVEKANLAICCALRHFNFLSPEWGFWL